MKKIKCPICKGKKCDHCNGKGYVKIDAEGEAKLRREIDFRIPIAEVISIRKCKMEGKSQTEARDQDSPGGPAM